MKLYELILAVVSFAASKFVEPKNLRHQTNDSQSNRSTFKNHRLQRDDTLVVFNKFKPNKRNQLVDSKVTAVEDVCPNPTKCIMKAHKDDGKNESHRKHENMIAICHYDLFFDVYKTICLDEKDLRDHFDFFYDDYCGVCNDTATATTSSTTSSSTTTTSSTPTTGQQATTDFPSFDDFYVIEPSSLDATHSDTPTTTPPRSFDWFETITVATTTTTNTITDITETELDMRESGFVVMNVTEYENDECTDATLITSTNVTIYGFLHDTYSENSIYFNYPCGPWHGGDWFRFQSTEIYTGIRFEYQLYSSKNGNSDFSIFTGSCDNLNCVINEVGETGDYGTEDWNDVVVYEFIPEPGEEYLIYLAGEHFWTSGEYELRITEFDITPVNDKCEGAIAVSPFPVPELMIGDNFGATPEFDEFDSDTCGVDWNSKGVWYSLEGRGTIVTIEYQLNSINQGNSVFSLFSGPCWALNCVYNEETQPSLLWSEELSEEYNNILIHNFFAEKGVSYKFLLTGEHSKTTGLHEFKVSEYEVPSNDKCEDAGGIEFYEDRTTYWGSTKGATPDFGNEGLEECGVPSNYTRGVWYNLTGNDRTIRIEYRLYSYYQNSTKLSVLKGSCGDWNCVGYAEADPSPFMSYKWNDVLVYDFFALGGENYLLYLTGGSFDTVGDYAFTVFETV